jgi:hypothetical protein
MYKYQPRKVKKTVLCRKPKNIKKKALKIKGKGYQEVKDKKKKTI